MDLRLAIAQQFGNPRGVLGNVVGRVMARGNGGFNVWVYEEIRRRSDPGAVSRVLELGHGPGVGLELLLAAYPQASVQGLEQSEAMIAQAARRNRAAVDAGRLELELGDATEARRLGPFDLIAAVHVIYFWPDPLPPLAALREALTPGGTLAIGMLLRGDMPKGARENFPKLATRLYETQDDVRGQLGAAGFLTVDVVVKPDAPGRNGLLVLARAS
jgi:SAM-dependent methyltransferase